MASATIRCAAPSLRPVIVAAASRTSPRNVPAIEAVSTRPGASSTISGTNPTTLTGNMASQYPASTRDRRVSGAVAMNRATAAGRDRRPLRVLIAVIITILAGPGGRDRFLLLSDFGGASVPPPRRPDCGQASRRASSQPPATSSTAAYAHSVASPAQADRE